MFLANVVALVENPSQCRMARNTIQNAPRPPSGHLLEAYERPTQTTDMLGQSLHEAQQSITYSPNGRDAILGKFADSPLTPDFQNLEFDDNQMWSNMFASAGFAIDDGTFLPHTCGNYVPG